MSERVRVADESEFGPGERAVVDANGVPVAVFNVDGEYYAVQNTCLHQYGPICKGLVQGALEATWEEPGERVEEYFSDRPAVACPWHGWEYDLETGVHLGDDDLALATFDVVVEDGSVFLEL